MGSQPHPGDANLVPLNLGHRTTLMQKWRADVPTYRSRLPAKYPHRESLDVHRKYVTRALGAIARDESALLVTEAAAAHTTLAELEAAVRRQFDGIEDADKVLFDPATEQWWLYPAK